MFLIDTNIFLEILLKQEMAESCKKFLEEHTGELGFTDFSLHSIGVILFRQEEKQLFLKFISDTVPRIHLISLPKDQYKEVISHANTHRLDFDDAYQYTVCKHYGFQLATMDQHFKAVKDIEVVFL